VKGFATISLYLKRNGADYWHSFIFLFKKTVVLITEIRELKDNKD